MAIVKAKYLPIRRSGGTYANNSLRYALQRETERGDGQERTAFDADRGYIKAEEALSEIEEAKGKYYYHLILNAGDGETSVDLQEWTKDTMSELKISLDKQDKGENLKWVAVEHSDHSSHDHVHIVMVTDYKLDKDDLKNFRDYSTQSFDNLKERIQDVNREFEKENFQDRVLQANISQVLQAVPSQSVAIAGGSEDNTNAPKKQKRENTQKKERKNDNSW